MNRASLCLLPGALAALCLLASPAACACEATQQRGGVTLRYQDAHDALPGAMRQRIIDTFFKAYLPQRADFHPMAPTQAAIVIDPAYDGIAYVGEKAEAATITINPAWLSKHPGDTDLVTHEAMHIVQGYPEYANERVPGWLVEGIADYARDRYGVDNTAAGWALPLAVKDGQNFDTGYRVTGAFLKWSEAAHPGLVKALDDALRSGAYTPALWKEQTGQALPALWAAYAAETHR
ncbi:basic secretory protein-like protein [Stenotrophomonas sp. CFBP8980]|uniref:basic secretory protein-like protein n=1 Tax=Stenotrophomonas sp. CFBP8980 TaxID=3096523 RepID=UPI002A6A922A|nr:basic secretory protein-like protein [Stenotrophomonas sp. CFBP8980]MDY1032680.1 basic secretory protein-like protein [Stenotrophomonas sp. CFBP8980]